MKGKSITGERDREATEKRLLDTIGKMIAEDGFEKIGINAIATQSGVSKILIYRYFGSVEGLMAAYNADVFLSSANALTDDGILINIDGNSNRVSCIAQGPKKVIFIVGINKICSDLDSAMKRARNIAAPANAQRFDIKTPCKETGKCFDCKSPDTICCQFLITRYSRHKDRIHVILVNDTLGF